jgi:hypothetical protein
MSKPCKIQVRKRFQRAVNLTADFQMDSAVRDFIVSQLAWETTCRFANGAATNNRAWALIGPYGSGKSSFAAFFANLISPEGRRSAMRRIRETWAENTPALLKTLRGTGDGFLPVPMVGERAPLAQIILQGIETALTTHWDGPGRSPAIINRIRATLNEHEGGRQAPDTEIVSLVCDAAKSVASAKLKGSGLCLILDEFGKALEWAAQNPSQTDLYLLQLLSEAANREEEGRFMLVTIQHQSMEAYADRLSVQQRREWEKVAGRFETVPYLESPRHLAGLVAEAIEATGPLKQLSNWKEHKAAVKAIGQMAKGDIPVAALKKSYPLHPTVALVLGPLFRLDLGQNERSLFSFLSSREPNAFQQYLQKWHQDPKAVSLFGLPELYDYVVANTRALISTSPEARIWGTAEEALRRLPEDAGKLDEDLIKVVAILSLVGNTVGLSASKDNLVNSLEGAKGKIEAAIRSLKSSSILIYRRFKKSYQLWDGSDLNVGELLSKGRDAVYERGDLAGQIEEVLTLPPYLAARHYLESGTLRSYECRFVSSQSLGELIHYQGHADGLIGIVLPEKNLASGVSSTENVHSGKPTLSLRLTAETPLVETLLDFLGAREALKSTSELENDPIARRALTELKLAANDRLQEQLTHAFNGKLAGSWFCNEEPVTKDGSLSDLATRTFNDSYVAAPCVHNELLNRGVLSSAAAAARRELLERMLLNASEDNLGIEGHPPELSMYLSVLDATKLHRSIKGQLQIAAPTPTSVFKEIWSSFDQIFSEKQSKPLSLKDVYDNFRKPPFGVREGLLPVILFSYLLVNKETAFLYEDGTFIPAIEKDHVQRFLSRPQTFKIQKLALTPKAKAAMIEARKALDGETNKGELLPTVKGLIQAVSGLSGFARQTNRISPEAKMLRSALVSARDPINLLCEGIPEALEIDGGAKSLKADLAPKLRGALDELKASEQCLVDEIKSMLLHAFGQGTVSSVDFASLRQRAESINLVAFNAQPLKRIVDVFSRLDSENPGTEWLKQFGLALVGKPVPQWRDEDIPIFRSVLFEAARQFAAAEAGSTDLNTTPLQNGSLQSEKLTSIAWLTSDSGYDTAVARVTPEFRSKLDRLLPKLRKMAMANDLDLRALLAAALVEEAGSKQPQSVEEAFALKV